MLEVAEIIRLHGAAYLARFADRILPSHRRALRDLDTCRTPALGGHVHQCDHCGRQVYAFHSCRNRHCPKCHRDQTDRWLTAQRARLLPCAHYVLTFTLPDQLRPLARSHQKIVYGLLMKSAAVALLSHVMPGMWAAASVVWRSCRRGHATSGTIRTSICS